MYKNYINGRWIDSTATEHFEIHDPATQELVAKVPQTTNSEFDEAV